MRRTRPKFVLPNLAILSNFGSVRPRFGRSQPEAAASGPILALPTQSWSRCSNIATTQSEIQPKSVLAKSATSGRNRSSVGRHRQNLFEFRSALANFAPCLPNLASINQNLADIGQIWPIHPQMWGGCARVVSVDGARTSGEEMSGAVGEAQGACSTSRACLGRCMSSVDRQSEWAKSGDALRLAKLGGVEVHDVEPCRCGSSARRRIRVKCGRNQFAVLSHVRSTALQEGFMRSMALALKN